MKRLKCPHTTTTFPCKTKQSLWQHHKHRTIRPIEIFLPSQHSTSLLQTAAPSLFLFITILQTTTALLLCLVTIDEGREWERAALYKPREGNPRAAKQIFWFWPWVEGRKGEVVRESPPFSFQPPPAATIFTATPFQLQTKNQDQIVCASWESKTS